MTDEDIHLTKEHPEADLQHIVHGIVRRGLKLVSMRPSHWRRKTLFPFFKPTMNAKKGWLRIVILISLIVLGVIGFYIFWFAQNDPLSAPAVHMQFY